MNKVILIGKAAAGKDHMRKVLEEIITLYQKKILNIMLKIIFGMNMFNSTVGIMDQV